MKKEKDPEKELRLLESAFKLFTEKGIKNTSIQEIVDNSKVAKGTFYLYFKDKYEIRDVLIAKKSAKLFSDALNELRKTYISNLDDQIVFIINYIIDVFAKNTVLLRFISKNLSLGIFNKSVEKLFCSELLMSAVSDYLSAGSFKNENYKSAAKKIMSRSSVSLRLFLSSVKAKEALYRMIKG